VSATARRSQPKPYLHLRLLEGWVLGKRHTEDAEMSKGEGCRLGGRKWLSLFVPVLCFSNAFALQFALSVFDLALDASIFIWQF